MQTIVLFHRCNFVYHHVNMLGRLRGHFNIIHLAYSKYEYDILKKCVPSVEATIFLDEIKRIYYQHPLNDTLLEEIDEVFLKETHKHFTLNASIQGDRSFHLLTYKESLRLMQAYYIFWKDFLLSKHANYVFHETVSLAFNHVGSVVCRLVGAHWIYQMPGNIPEYSNYHWYLENEIYDSEMLENRYLYYLKCPEKINVDMCKHIVSMAKQTNTIAAAYLVKKEQSLLELWLKAILVQCRNKIVNIIKRNQFDRQTEPLEYLGNLNETPIQTYRNIKAYKQYIKFDQIHPDERYYYYPFHLEPEATITYLCEQMYSNQINLIKNIAAQLPVGIYLYVKDHPHAYGYRNYSDYQQLMNVPNIRLLERSIPGKEVIKGAIGVFTINGTAGCEALLMKKPVYCFGRTYYSCYSGVRYIDNVKEIRHILYDEKLEIKENDLYAWINAMVDCLYPGKVWFFRHPSMYKDIDLKVESCKFVDSFMDYIKRIGSNEID